MKKKVALVLSGGGARGIAHIGAIEAIENQGFEIHSVAGTSMGALVGGVYALGKLDEFKHWLFSLDKMKVFRLVDFTFSSQGLVKGDKVLGTMRDFIQDENIENLNIKYLALATDIINKKEVVFNKGSIYEAIRASISIPTVLTPVKTKSGLLVDGGVLNNIPVNHVARTKNDILIAVDVNADIPELKPKLTEEEEKGEKELNLYQQKMAEFKNHLHKILPSKEKEQLGYFKLLDGTINLMMDQASRIALETYPPDVLVNISRNTCSTFDFYKAEELVEIGRTAALQSLEKYRN